MVCWEIADIACVVEVFIDVFLLLVAVEHRCTFHIHGRLLISKEVIVNLLVWVDSVVPFLVNVELLRNLVFSRCEVTIDHVLSGLVINAVVLIISVHNSSVINFKLLLFE